MSWLPIALWLSWETRISPFIDSATRILKGLETSAMSTQIPMTRISSSVVAAVRGLWTWLLI